MEAAGRTGVTCLAHHINCCLISSILVPLAEPAHGGHGGALHVAVWGGDGGEQGACSTQDTAASHCCKYQQLRVRKRRAQPTRSPASSGKSSSLSNTDEFQCQVSGGGGVVWSARGSLDLSLRAGRSSWCSSSTCAQEATYNASNNIISLTMATGHFSRAYVLPRDTCVAWPSELASLATVPRQTWLPKCAVQMIAHLYGYTYVPRHYWTHLIPLQGAEHRGGVGSAMPMRPARKPRDGDVKSASAALICCRKPSSVH